MSAYAAVVSLKQYISTLLYYCDKLFPPLTIELLDLAHKELNSLKNLVERLDGRSRKGMGAWLGCVADAMRKFEEDAEINLKGGNFDQFLEDTHSLIETLKNMQGECYSSSLSRVVSKSKMVGSCDELSQLKEYVIQSRVQNSVFSVVGMAGIGKTTLAREIFEDLDVSELFDCRAWVRVGTEWKPKEITEAILAEVDPDVHKMLKAGGYHDEDEISKRLKESLKDKRYFIVLDDVWHYNVHHYLKTSLPYNEKGSRVLLTTRVKYEAQDLSYICHMRLLNKEESWDLLREKVFAGGSCPPQLEKAGEKIAEKCDGLPLTIVTVAALLTETPESLWINIAEQKKHQLFIDAYDQISKVLYPSYKMLYDEFKFCFLYMGVFPQKFEIPRTKLINLWIVEDIVRPSKNRTLESSAAECLQFLNFCCLVMVYQSSSSRSPFTTLEDIKRCGLHSSWWQFCQREARKNRFFHVLDSYKDGSKEIIRGHSRLSVHNNVLFALKDVHNSMEENCAFSALSLLCFGPYNQYMVPICFGLKLLRRLDALNIRFYDFPLEVLELVKLRYLALTCNKMLPPSISKLQKLQYLIVHRHLSIKSHGAPSHLPMEIWDMKKLKHLKVMGCDLPNLGDTSLEKLLTLSDVTPGSFTVLKRVPNLKKLGIKIELTPDAADPLCCFDPISHLNKLKSLKYVIVNPDCKFELVYPVPSLACLPILLNKLSLSGLGYPWEDMSMVALLPNLKVLKLQCNGFRGPKWKVEENGFPKLYHLLIEDLDLVKFEAARGSFKLLEYLTIKHCYKLEELHFGHVQIFSKIEVVDCSPLVEKNINESILFGRVAPNIFSVESSCYS